MKKSIIYIFVLFSICTFSQESTHDKLPELLNKYNNRSVPYISVQELAMPKTDAIILDAREINEYNVSHLKDAIYVGYDFFEIGSVQQKLPNKDAQIVVYCSIGIRSEIIASKLKKSGYANVLNLYGGIFEWKNKGFKVYDLNDKETEKVHVNNIFWGLWLTKGEKVYE